MLHTPRLTLRRFRPDDLRDLHAYLSDPEVVRFEPYPPQSEAQCRQFLLDETLLDAFLAVDLPSEGQVIGQVSLVERPQYTREIGYVFGRPYHGQGYASEAVAAVITHAVAQGAHRIIANCNPENTRSWQLLERLGLRREGQHLQNRYFSLDEWDRPIWQDTWAYAMLADEWRTLQNKQSTDHASGDPSPGP